MLERVYYLSSWTKSLGFSTCVTRKIKQRTDLNSRSDIPRYYPPFHLLNSYQNEGNIWHGHGKNIWMGYCFIGSSLLSKTKYILVMLIVIQINSVYFVAWLFLCLKQLQQNKCLVKLKTQFIFGEAQCISRLKRKFYQSSSWLLFFFTVYFFKWTIFF